MRRWALAGLLPLLLIAAPGAAAASCTAVASGTWEAPSTWSCNAVPADGDAVLIPAGKTVTLTDAESAASLTLQGGTLALGENELDLSGFTAGGGTISGTPDANFIVNLAGGAQAVVGNAGLTLDGAYIDVGGSGTLGISGPLTLRNGGWFESDVNATWSGSAPWQLGGPGTPPSSGFDEVGAQLTTVGATAAQDVGAGDDGVIQIDSGGTLFKQDATTTTINADVVLDNAYVHVLAGTLIGGLQGDAVLDVAPGATLGLSGTGTQLVPDSIGLTGGSIEAEAGSNVELDLPGPPALHRLAVDAGAQLDVSVGSGDPTAPPDVLADAIAIGAGSTLSMDDGTGGLKLANNDVLSGTGSLDAALDNAGGTVSPNGSLHVTGDYTQEAGGTLALDLRSAGDGDSLHVDGSAILAGALHVSTTYSPAAAASPLVLAAGGKPDGTFSKVSAALPGGRAWQPVYAASGVSLSVSSAGAAGNAAGAPDSLTSPSLEPRVPVVGGSTHCLPGTWKGAHALTYQWLLGSKPIAGATGARYLVPPADRGRRLACRVTATATGGQHEDATSRHVRARTGLRIGDVVADAGGALSASVHCARSEIRCSGSLRVLVSGHVVARGRFDLASPGGVVQLTPVDALHAGDAASVLARYRNAAGQRRFVQRSAVLSG